MKKLQILALTMIMTSSATTFCSGTGTTSTMKEKLTMKEKFASRLSSEQKAKIAAAKEKLSGSEKVENFKNMSQAEKRAALKSKIAGSSQVQAFQKMTPEEQRSTLQTRLENRPTTISNRQDAIRERMSNSATPTTGYESGSASDYEGDFEGPAVD